MIPVQAQPEPPNFTTSVETPGNKFLALDGHPSSWRGHEYWRAIIPEPRESYKEICTYACHWIPPDTGMDTVEHFVPKSVAPHLAYDWKNYRLVSSRLNGRKGNYQDVLDPFTLQPNWFYLTFPALLIVPNSNIEEKDKKEFELQFVVSSSTMTRHV